jgi:uncharacterized protein (DUF2147 family)
MKKITGTLLLALFISLQVFSQADADKIIGDWVTGDKSGYVRIYKQGGKYFGKIIGGNTPELKDVKNDDPKLRNRDLLNVVILTNLEFIDGKWENGKIYDPQSGNTYKCIMWMKDNDTLEVKGYVGISLFGRTETWVRIKK